METRTSDFHFFLKSVSQRFTSVSIFNSEFKCLHINTPYINNSVGLMTSLKTLKNFFPWDGSLVVIHNDPLLGCSQSNRIQFLFSSESFHFCIEESFNCTWDFTKKMIKIPPIPIVENGQINMQMVDALTAQGDCPTGLNQFFRAVLKKIEKFQADYKNLMKSHAHFSDKDLHKDYLSSVGNSSLKTIKSKTYVSAQVEYEFDPGTFLKIKASTSEIGVRIDFQGTTNHPSIQMADPITDSICFSFFADYFQFADLMNDATFSHFQIAKPTQSLANSKTFTNKVYSDYCGADVIQQALLDCWTEKTNLKSYLVLKSYIQFTGANGTVDFQMANSKSLGSAALGTDFEPLISSRPTPGADHMPTLKDFNRAGVDVKLSQYQFRSTKAKETNDFQALIQIDCIEPVQVAVMSPCQPSKIKTSKVKSTLIKPTLSINGKPLETLSAIKNLAVGDQVLVKSGAIDFA